MIPFPFQVAQFGMALPASSGAGVQYVGGQVSGRQGSASTLPGVAFSLTGGIASTPAADDLVIITCVVGSAADRQAAQAVSGYTSIGFLGVTAANFETAMDVSYKRMTGTPDTTFTLPSSGAAADAQSYAVQVWRGVDPSANIAALAVSATGSGTGRPNPAAVTPTVPGSVVCVCGGGAAGTGAAYTAPANFSTNWLTNTTADTNDSMLGAGYWTGWTSGAVDPDAYTGGTTNAADSWACYTLVLPPA